MSDIPNPFCAEMLSHNTEVNAWGEVIAQSSHFSIFVILSRDKVSFLVKPREVAKGEPVAFDGFLTLIVQLGYQFLEFFLRLSLSVGLPLHAAPFTCLINIGQPSAPALFSRNKL